MWKRYFNIFTTFISFFFDIWQNRKILFALTRQEMRTRYIGSYFGVLWAFIQPIATIAVFWFVFDIGFKTQPIKNYPYILWLLGGIIPWFFLSEALLTSTGSVIGKSYLVQKIKFRVSLLPVIQIFSAIVVHIFFIVVMFAFFLAYGYSPQWHWIQIFYFTFCAIILLLGLSWLTSSITVFFRDLGQLINIIIQFGFWLTPIFWSIDIMPEKYRFYLKLNPVFYITEGYRSSLMQKEWFWEHWIWAGYFWGITLFLLFLGAYVFYKLRPHFADVL